MKAIRNTALQLVAVSLLVSPLAGCGVENAVGPVAERTPAAVSDARTGANDPDLSRANLVVEDPGSPDDTSQLSASASGASYVAGSGNNGNGNGNGRPPKVHKPKKRRH